MTPFDPKKHLIKLQGKSYLPAAARILWFRSVHPLWSIVTQPVDINKDKQYAIFRCEIRDEEGRIVSTGTKHEDVKGFGDYIEKSEMGAVSRALGMVGFGTQFDKSFHEGMERLADSPQDLGTTEEIFDEPVKKSKKTKEEPDPYHYWSVCEVCEAGVFYSSDDQGVTWLVQNADGEKHAHQLEDAVETVEIQDDSLLTV